MRTWPASTSAAALVRALTSRACHNHLSRRWRSKQHPRGTYFIFLTRFLPQISLRNLRKLDCYANRYPLRLKALWVLPVGGHLLLERGQLGERRIRIDRTITLARGGARGILPMRWTAFPAASVAVTPRPATLVASALVASTLVT